MYEKICHHVEEEEEWGFWELREPSKPWVGSAVGGARAGRRDIPPHKSSHVGEWKWQVTGGLTSAPSHFQRCVALRSASWKAFPRCLPFTNQLGSQFQRLPSAWFLWLNWTVPMWVLSIHHPWVVSLLHSEDHFCFGDRTPCSWETTQNWGQSATDKQLPDNLGLPPVVQGLWRMTNRL